MPMISTGAIICTLFAGADYCVFPPIICSTKNRGSIDSETIVDSHTTVVSWGFPKSYLKVANYSINLQEYNYSIVKKTWKRFTRRDL